MADSGMPSSSVDREAGEGGVQERPAHGGDGVAERVQGLADGQHPVLGVPRAGTVW